MKKLLALLLTFILLIQLPVAVSYASFDDQGGGARAFGMAETFTAIADDADAIAYNPAGLVQIQEGQITTQYGELVKGLGDGSSLGSTYLGYAFPFVRGYKALGFAYNNFKGDNLFNERTLIMSYGQRIDLESFGYHGIFSIGGNFKQLHRQFEPDRFSENALNDAGVASNQKDQLFTKGKVKDTYAVDLGGLAQFGPQYQYTAGFAIINMNQPDVSLGGDGDKAPLGVTLAAAYRPKWGTISVETRHAKRLVGQMDNDLALGIERNIPFESHGALVLRGGYATGSRGYRALTTGLSYLFSRFRLDYAFSFPVGNFADTSGTHRIGFSYKVGAGIPQLAKDYSNADLLSAFSYNSLTTHLLLTRLSLARGLTPEYKDRLMLLLMRKYPLDDPGFKGVNADLRDLFRKHDLDLGTWSQLKSALIKGISAEERVTAAEILELLVKNDAKAAYMKLALLPIPVQQTDRITTLSVIALGELSAQAYRRQELDTCLDNLRRLVEIMPSDEVVLRAYRDLLARRARITDKFNQTTTQKLSVPEPMPEAPQTLVAPHPQEETVLPPTPEQEAMSEKDMSIKAFGTALGYYMMRKSANASREELLGLLNQMKALYGSIGIDMSLVDNELDSLNRWAPVATPTVAPTEKPAVLPTVAPIAKPAAIKPATKPIVVKPIKDKPTVKPVPKATIKPKESVSESSELERAWSYYQNAVAREISDHEKVELLQDMLRQFGEQGAGQVNKELERIRRRLE